MLIFLRRDPEKKDCLQARGTSTVRFLRDVRKRKLLNARHGADWTPLLDFFAHEERQDKIVRRQFRLADQIAQPFRTAETSRTVQQFPHNARLRARLSCRKLDGTLSRMYAGGFSLSLE